jgi:hypothetical protein
LPAASSLFATDTPAATLTFTPSSTPTSTSTATLTVTYTPRPTPTATPDQRILNPANQHLYLYVRILKTWHQARDYCIYEGGHLVTIQGPWENKFVYELDQLAFDNGKHYAHNSTEFWLIFGWVLRMRSKMELGFGLLGSLGLTGIGKIMTMPQHTF